MKRSSLSIAILAVFAVLAAGVIVMPRWLARETKTAAHLKKPRTVIQPEPVKTSAGAMAPPADGLSEKASTSADYKKSFADARDYSDYAHQILPAARAGNADAQLFLFKVLDFCDHPGYFELNGGKFRTLDEAIRFAAAIPAPIEPVQLMYDRCHQFFNQQGHAELGNAMDWLAQATAAGQPVAQATTAQLRMGQDDLKQYVKAGASPTELTTAPLIGGAADPRGLLRAAVESRDPEVIFDIGTVQGDLNPSLSRTDQIIHQIAWMYLACQRGLDCPANGQGRKGDWGSVDNLMSMAKDNWPAAQQLAQQINAKLDAGQWDELGLGSAPVPTSSQ
jgi:hypothetical protein